MIFLEDLVVGQRFTAGPIQVTAEAIKGFAAEYDPQPFHLDEDAAATHPVFGGLAASGWHTAAMAMRMTVQALGHFGWGVVGGGGDLQWVRPVRPGDTLKARREILAVTPSQSRPDRGTVKTKTWVSNQDGDVVMSFENLMQLPKDASARL